MFFDFVTQFEKRANHDVLEIYGMSDSNITLELIQLYEKI